MSYDVNTKHLFDFEQNLTNSAGTTPLLQNNVIDYVQPGYTGAYGWQNIGKAAKYVYDNNVLGSHMATFPQVTMETYYKCPVKLKTTDGQGYYNGLMYNDNQQWGIIVIEVSDFISDGGLYLEYPAKTPQTIPLSTWSPSGWPVGTFKRFQMEWTGTSDAKINYYVDGALVNTFTGIQTNPFVGNAYWFWGVRNSSGQGAISQGRGVTDRLAISNIARGGASALQLSSGASGCVVKGFSNNRFDGNGIGGVKC